MPIGINKVSRNSQIGSDIPDSGELHSHWDASSIIDSSIWENQAGEADLSAVGGPTVLASEKNGNNVIRYDGNNDYHELSSFNTSISPPVTLFVVFRYFNDPSNTSSDNYITGAKSGRSLEFRMEYVEEKWEMADSDETLLGGPADTNWHIGALFFLDNSNGVLRIDGTNQAAGGSFTNTLSDFAVAEVPWTDGTSNYHAPVDVGEILLYPQDKGGSLSSIESYLSDKWGITL